MIDFFEWYGWKSSNTCLASYFNSSGVGENRNLGITVFPLQFWNHIGFSIRSFGAFNKRVFIGIGIVSVFWDFKPTLN